MNFQNHRNVFIIYIYIKISLTDQSHRSERRVVDLRDMLHDENTGVANQSFWCGGTQGTGKGSCRI